MRIHYFLLTSFLAAVSALTITLPSGDSLDPTQPISVKWTSTSSDPPTIDLVLDQPNGGVISNQILASNVPTSDGAYTIPSGATMTWGTGYVIKARSPSGDDLASTPQFALSVGSATTIDGKVSYVSTYTFTGSADASGTAQSLVAASTTAASSATPTNPSPSGNTTTASSSMSSGFSTSTTPKASFSSSTRSSSASSASATTSQNAQPRLGSNSQVAFSAAGIIAGLAALLA